MNVLPHNAPHQLVHVHSVAGAVEDAVRYRCSHDPLDATADDRLTMPHEAWPQMNFIVLHEMLMQVKDTMLHEMLQQMNTITVLS